MWPGCGKGTQRWILGRTLRCRVFTNESQTREQTSRQDINEGHQVHLSHHGLSLFAMPQPKNAQGLHLDCLKSHVRRAKTDESCSCQWSTPRFNDSCAWTEWSETAVISHEQYLHRRTLPSKNATCAQTSVTEKLTRSSKSVSRLRSRSPRNTPDPRNQTRSTGPSHRETHPTLQLSDAAETTGNEKRRLVARTSDMPRARSEIVLSNRQKPEETKNT